MSNFDEWRLLKKWEKSLSQERRCTKCDALIEVVEMKNLSRPVRRIGICQSCMEQRWRNLSESRRGENNPNWTGREKRPRLTKEEVATLARKRMRENNPMKNPGTVSKVVSSLRAGKEEGRIVYKKGPEHHRWRGNREPSFIIRTRLTHWRKACLQNDGYQCVDCGVNSNKLEVHHSGKAFRHIVEEGMAELDIATLSGIDVDSEAFQNLCDVVVRMHNGIEGTTLCQDCHSRRDPKRRKPAA